MNYSRSFFFDFLPFYHMGVRASLPLTDKFTVNYWVVNGTNQVEATNGFKDELFGFVYKPTKTITWTSNYYLGQEHPDRTVSAIPTNPVPVQPGLNFIAIRPAPNGRTHIFDNYVTWQPTPKLTIAVEGDYFIQRLWHDQAPGESAAPHPTSPAAPPICNINSRRASPSPPAPNIFPIAAASSAASRKLSKKIPSPSTTNSATASSCATNGAATIPISRHSSPTRKACSLSNRQPQQ